jgi:anaphase-promoting complex subunit 1
MSRVSSLGLHSPTALPYCVTEGLLPDQPSPNSYTWTTGLPHEELLVTGNAVIWSQGGIIRRVFRYDVEKEPVVQAVLTWFPSDNPLDAIGNVNDADDDADGAGYISGGSEGNKRKPDWSDDVKAKKRLSTWNSKTRSYATQLGSFPKARGSDGTGGSSGAATEDNDEVVKSGRARALVIFQKTQAFVYHLSGTMHIIHLPFEIQHAMPTPRGLILQRKHQVPPPPAPFSTGNAFARRPPIAVKDFPSLFTLTDPLSEPGLVMSTANTPCTEGLLYISPFSELDPTEQQEISPGKPNPHIPEVIFAVTHNHERSMITVWQVRYVPQDKPVNPQRRTPSASGTASRRRSSFGPGTGASTPATVTSSSTLVGKTGRDSLGPSEISTLNVLGEDFETVGGRRSSRRVSSMMARADLSGNHESSHRFSDVSNTLGTSFGAPPVPQNTQNSMLPEDQPVDELLNELNMGSLGLGMDDLGSYDDEGLKQEVLMHKLESFPSRLSETKGSDPDTSPRVFTMRDPPSMAAASIVGKEAPGKQIVLFMMNRNERSLLQVTFNIQIHTTGPKGYSRRSSTKFGVAAMGYSAVTVNTQKREDVLDAIKVQDNGMQKVLILTDAGKFILYSPWGGMVGISLPPTLARWNPSAVGEDGSRRGSRKKEWARTLSTTPDKYRQLEYSDPGGRLTVVDGEGVSHRISITLAPRETATRMSLETLRIVLGGSLGVAVGEGICAAWMTVAKWLHSTSDPEASLNQDMKGLSPADEWKAFVVTVFLLGVSILPEPKAQPRRKSAFIRSTSMVAEREWEDFASHEGDWGSSPEFMRNSPWRWMADEQDERAARQQHQSPSKARGTLGAASEGKLTNKFITDCIHQARQLMRTPIGEDVEKNFFGSAGNLVEVRRTGLAVALVSLQLLREEWKLDISMEGPARRLCPFLKQIATWLGWTTWAQDYTLEDVEMFNWAYDDCLLLSPKFAGCNLTLNHSSNHDC